MLSPSDFNNAVPQFTNGNYASNPINPQYIAEPDAVSYNRGTEPLQTLPAQWWNWFLNKFTGRFNKVNVYVKNIFNELAQVLSIFEITPDGTEQTPTTTQLKTVFECCYPEYVKTAASLVGTETTVNGHPLSSNVTVTRSDLGLGTSATVNTGTAAGCIPTVGTALGTTNNNILVTDSTGKLKPSGITVGTAAGCDASAFRASTWTPALVECANKGKNGSSYSAFGSNAFNSTAFTTCTGTVTKVKVGSTEYSPSSGVVSLPAYPSTPTVVCCAKCNGSGTAFGTAAICAASAFRSCTWIPDRVVACCIGSAAAVNNVYMMACCSAQKASACYVCATPKVTLCATNGYLYIESMERNYTGATTYTTNYNAHLSTVEASGSSVSRNMYFHTSCTTSGGAITHRTSYICGADGNYYGNVCGSAQCLCGSTINSVRQGCWSCGNFGCAFYNKNSLTHEWTVYTRGCAYNCDIYKAVCCGIGMDSIATTGYMQSHITGQIRHNTGGSYNYELASLFREASTCFVLKNISQSLYAVFSASNTCLVCLTMGGTYF